MKKTGSLKRSSVMVIIALLIRACSISAYAEPTDGSKELHITPSVYRFMNTAGYNIDSAAATDGIPENRRLGALSVQGDFEQ